MSTGWNAEEVRQEPKDVRWAINPRSTFQSPVGEVYLFDENNKDAVPTTLNIYLRPPRVDVHCHLIQAIQTGTLDKASIEKVVARLRDCTVFSDASVDQYCTERRTDGDNKLSFISYALSNNAIVAVPAVLSAVMRAAQHRVDHYRQPERLEQAFAIAVPLSLDLAFMPMQAINTEDPTSLIEPLALLIRALVDKSVVVRKLPEHLKSFFLGVHGAFHIVDADEKMLKNSIETLSEIARHSRGTLQPFLAFDPRRWVENVRSKIPSEKLAYESAGDYLGQYIFSQKETQLASTKFPHRGFAGLKLYTRHGWALSDNSAIYGDEIGGQIDHQVSEMLKFANVNCLPITNHHSPGGTPPNNFLVPPLEMVQQNRTKIPDPTGSDNVTDASNASKWLTWIAAAETAYFCEYVERTTSPLNWESVLKQFPNMRVNLAHAGSAASMLAHLAPNTCWVSVLNAMESIRKSGDVGTVDKEIVYLLQHPMAVQQELFEGIFWESVRLKVLEYSKTILNGRMPYRFTANKSRNFRLAWDKEFSQALDRRDKEGDATLHSSMLKRCSEIASSSLGFLEKLRASDEWMSWCQKWCQQIHKVTRKENWFESICRICRENPNAYMDFSYATSSRQQVRSTSKPKSETVPIVATALRHVFNDEILKHKAMFGTDWFLIEQDIGSADDAWRIYGECFKEAGLNEADWDRFAGLNAIKFLDLASRSKGLDEFVSATGAKHLRYWPVSADSTEAYSSQITTKNGPIDNELFALRKAAETFAMDAVSDSSVRLDYIERAKLVSARFKQAVLRGDLNVEHAAKAASEIRNQILEVQRLKLLPIGRSVSEAIKEHPIQLHDLQAKYAKELFHLDDFSRLTIAQQSTVNLQIVSKSGVTNEHINKLSKTAGKFGRGLVLFSAGIAVYNVYSAEDKAKASTKEVAGLGAGLVVGTVAASLACGPGAPVCATLAMFVGSFMAAYGTEYAIEYAW